MKDLFNPIKTEKSIVSDSNGRTNIRRSGFTKSVTRNKRNASFSEILTAHGGLPKPNECLLIKSNGCSDTGSIFHHMIEIGTCEELYLSTWIISRDNIDYICEQFDKGNINNITFIISVRQKQLKKANYAHMVEQFQKRNIKFRVCNCHAKTFSAKIGKNYYTVTGSGNWTKNPRIENYMITNDKNIFDFNKDWMTELL